MTEDQDFPAVFQKFFPAPFFSLTFFLFINQKKKKTTKKEIGGPPRSHLCLPLPPPSRSIFFSGLFAAPFIFFFLLFSFFFPIPSLLPFSFFLFLFLFLFFFQLSFQMPGRAEFSQQSIVISSFFEFILMIFFQEFLNFHFFIFHFFFSIFLFSRCRRSFFLFLFFFLFFLLF